MPTGERKDPYRGYNFKLEIDGINRNGFRECSGLDATSDPIDYREGDEKVYTNRKLPGQTKYSNISLKMGKTDDKDLWEWRQKVIDGKTERKNGSIILLDQTGSEKLRWNVGYQYYGYHEEFGVLSQTQNYRAHTGYTSLTLAF